MLTREFDDDVEAYTSQPLSINYVLNEKEIRYTPDILVQTIASDFYFIEVKSFYAFQLEKNRQKFAYLQSHFREKYQRELKLISCRDIYIDAQITNLDSLYRFKKFSVSKEAEELFSELPNVINSMAYQQLCRDKNTHRFNNFMTLVAHNFFKFDATQPFDSQQSLFKKMETLCNY